jgi:hypothetical protein
LPQPVANIGLRPPDADINQLRERCSPQALDWNSHPRLDRTSGRPQAGSAEPPDKPPGGFALHNAGFVFCRLLIRPDLSCPFDLFGNLFVLGDCVCELLFQRPCRRFFPEPSGSRCRCTVISCGPLFHWTTPERSFSSATASGRSDQCRGLRLQRTIPVIIAKMKAIAAIHTIAPTTVPRVPKMINFVRGHREPSPRVIVYQTLFALLSFALDSRPSLRVSDAALPRSAVLAHPRAPGRHPRPSRPWPPRTTERRRRWRGWHRRNRSRSRHSQRRGCPWV